MAEDLIIITAQIGVYYYIIVFVPLQEKAASTFLQLSNFDRFGKPPSFDAHSQFLDRVAKGYKITLNIVVISYFFEPILMKHICEKQNEAINLKDICGLVVASWMPFDIETFPNKHIFYLMQTWSCYWTYEGSAAISYLIAATMEHVLIRIWHLKTLIREAVNTHNDKLRKERFVNCVKYHIDIINIACNVDTIYKRCLFVHIFITGILFGIMGFCILSVGVSPKVVSLFVAWLGAVILASFAAQRILDASIAIGEEVYNTDWSNANCSFQKDLLMIIQKSRQPITIHAGPIATISHVSVLMIFKTAYSYLTLLKATSN